MKNRNFKYLTHSKGVAGVEDYANLKTPRREIGIIANKAFRRIAELELKFESF